MRLVLDASVAAALAIGERPAARLLPLQARIAREGALVPPCFPAEVEKALSAGVRAGRLAAARARAAREALLAQVEVCAPPEVFLQNHRLTTNDAAYLALAAGHGATLATLDRALAKAARKEGLAVLP